MLGGRRSSRRQSVNARESARRCSAQEVARGGAALPAPPQLPRPLASASPLPPPAVRTSSAGASPSIPCKITKSLSSTYLPQAFIINPAAGDQSAREPPKLMPISSFHSSFHSDQRESFREDAVESRLIEWGNCDLRERPPSRRRGAQRTLMIGTSSKNILKQMGRRGSQPASSPDLPEAGRGELPERKNLPAPAVRRASLKQRANRRSQPAPSP